MMQLKFRHGRTDGRTNGQGDSRSRKYETDSRITLLYTKWRDLSFACLLLFQVQLKLTDPIELWDLECHAWMRVNLLNHMECHMEEGKSHWMSFYPMEFFGSIHRCPSYGVSSSGLCPFLAIFQNLFQPRDPETYPSLLKPDNHMGICTPYSTL